MRGILTFIFYAFTSYFEILKAFYYHNYNVAKFFSLKKKEKQQQNMKKKIVSSPSRTKTKTKEKKPKCKRVNIA